MEFSLQSKVDALYGNSIRKLCLDILQYYNIRHAKVFVEDSGALDFVIAARMEAAIRQLIKTSDEYLLPMQPGQIHVTEKDRSRRSRLYLPGNTPKLMINAGIHSADGIILDLEDSVAPDRKHEARFLVRNALRSLDFYSAEKMVRINQVPEGLNDLNFVIPHAVNLILVPKCETADDIIHVNERINQLQDKPERPVFLMPIIESSKGVIHAYTIASAAENIVALAIGLEDYTADLGVSRTEDGTESLYARNVIVNVAAAAGIQAIDSVYSDISDLEGLRLNVARSKAMGFVGMGCIHPRQIKIIHEGFNPKTAEIERSKEIVIAFEEAKRKGSGVIVIGSKMVDMPVVKRAFHTIKTALENGLLNENWKEEIHG